MLKILAFILFFLSWSEFSLAQPAFCVDATAVWTTSYPQGNIQSISYYLWQQRPPQPGERSAPPLPVLSVIYRPGGPSAEAHIHVNVPLSVAQQFTALSSADQRYVQTVKSRYQQLLLGEDLCPLIIEIAEGCPLVNENDFNHLMSEVGTDLVSEQPLCATDQTAYMLGETP
jgi:hypothetical protein